MRSRPVKRIKDVRNLRARQFPEDAGPLAHPVRPDSYIAIDNFYTATVYEKRSAEPTSELQSLMRSSYAVFCLTQTAPRGQPLVLRKPTTHNTSAAAAVRVAQAGR